MKKSSLILAILFLISMSSFQVTFAQEKTKEDKDKELNEVIEAQKKAMVEQKKAQEKAQEEVQKALEKAKLDQEAAMEDSKASYQDAMKEYQDQFDQEKFQKSFRNFRMPGNGRNFNNGEPFIISPDVNFYRHSTNGDSESTSWDFSKSIKESSFSREYIFDVEQTANTVVMSINGDCKAGDIRIKIVMPGGKVYSDITIDESGNLNWRKSFVISDTENKDKAGAWKFEINASKATGYFKISLQTY
jgi:hypothetical protein